MKLLEVFNAVSTSEEKPVSSWQSVSGLKKSPGLAYKLLKYGDKLAGEYAVIEKQRNALVYEVSGADQGEAVKIEPGTPDHKRFVSEFMEFLNKESELEVTGITMDALIADLEKKDGNMLSEADLMLVEPFFKEKPKPEKPAE